MEPTRVEPLTGLYSIARLLALPTNIRLGYKQMKVANTLAYFDTVTIMELLFIGRPLAFPENIRLGW